MKETSKAELMGLFSAFFFFDYLQHRIVHGPDFILYMRVAVSTAVYLGVHGSLSLVNKLVYNLFTGLATYFYFY